jgi:hypothetical protein
MLQCGSAGARASINPWIGVFFLLRTGSSLAPGLAAALGLCERQVYRSLAIFPVSSLLRANEWEQMKRAAMLVGLRAMMLWRSGA